VQPHKDFKGCTGQGREVDHIDGDVENNNDDNLRALCAPCHKEVTKQNWLDSRNLHNPRTSPNHPGVLVEMVKEATDEDVDDLPTDNEDEWITSFGPVFEKLDDGSFKQPEKTLGKHVVQWVMKNLRLNGKPLVPTPEQYRLIMWMYAIDSEGRWLYNRTLHIAPKGWGKDPFGAMFCAVELCGPSRFSHWDEKGNPVPMRCEEAWVQIAAVSLSQNENTLKYLKGMFSPEAIERYQIEIQAETIWAFNRRSKIHSIASSSLSLEGNYPSASMQSELQHFFESNGCHKLFKVLKRNLDKVNNSHSYFTTNAYNPNEGSIAQMLHEKWMDQQAGLAKPSKLMVVMKSASRKAPYLTMEQRMKVLNRVYGSSAAYTNLVQLAETFDDNTDDPSEPLRFYYNTIGIESMSWIDIRDFDKCKNRDFPEDGLPLHTKLVLFGDFSFRDDATILVGMVTEGKFAKTLVTFGCWERPKHLRGDAAENWVVPRDEVDATVHEIFKKYKVQGFWCDPSHRMQSEGGGSLWLPLINEWSKKYSRKLSPILWAKGTEHATNWDMTSHANQRVFVEALSGLQQEISDGTIKHDGSTDMRRHMMNARRVKSKRFGESIQKPSPRSKSKIDLAVGAAGCYAMYTKLMTNKKTRTNRMGGYVLPENQKEVTNNVQP
jgi:hypothetical protein